VGRYSGALKPEAGRVVRETESDGFDSRPARLTFGFEGIKMKGTIACTRTSGEVHVRIWVRVDKMGFVEYSYLRVAKPFGNYNLKPSRWEKTSFKPEGYLSNNDLERVWEELKFAQPFGRYRI
jgi:hypothetical protein